MKDGIRLWFKEIHFVGQTYFCREDDLSDMAFDARYVDKVTEQCNQSLCKRGLYEDCF
jgi:hypothetical protein